MQKGVRPKNRVCSQTVGVCIKGRNIPGRPGIEGAISMHGHVEIMAPGLHNTYKSPWF